jgi:hypothetical protein
MDEDGLALMAFPFFFFYTIDCIYCPIESVCWWIGEAALPLHQKKKLIDKPCKER